MEPLIDGKNNDIVYCPHCKSKMERIVGYYEAYMCSSCRYQYKYPGGN